MELPTPQRPHGLPVTFHGYGPVAVAAVLRPSSTPGKWMVWPDESRMCHIHTDPRTYYGREARRALDGPMYDFEAARRYPEHAHTINSRPDTSD